MILGVNIDHVATLRQARKGDEPDPLMAAPLAILGGADGITVHLREDRRHIVDRDLRLLREVVPIELNLEMAATDEMISIAIEVRPDMATIVPEKREELTTEGGLDIGAVESYLAVAIARLHENDIPVSLFIDPEVEAVDLARRVGADMVELHTGLYANAGRGRCGEELLRIVRAAEHCLDVGLLLNAGHGLNYRNVGPIAAIEGMRGLYIGHSIIARAVLVGLERAVAEMKTLIRESAS
jgi:pyridoxine 5-phosphate synthase